MLSLCHTFIKANQTISYNTTAHTRQPLKSRCLKTTIFGTKSFAVPYVVLKTLEYCFSMFTSFLGKAIVCFNLPEEILKWQTERLTLKSTRWRILVVLLHPMKAGCRSEVRQGEKQNCFFSHAQTIFIISKPLFKYLSHNLLCCQVYQCFFSCAECELEFSDDAYSSL